MDRHDDARFAGTFVLNRCVFIRAGVPHEVKPVAAAAGPRLRTSVIGYTYRLKT